MVRANRLMRIAATVTILCGLGLLHPANPARAEQTHEDARPIQLVRLGIHEQSGRISAAGYLYHIEDPQNVLGPATAISKLEAGHATLLSSALVDFTRNSIPDWIAIRIHNIGSSDGEFVLGLGSSVTGSQQVHVVTKDEDGGQQILSHWLGIEHGDKSRMLIAHELECPFTCAPIRRG